MSVTNVTLLVAELQINIVHHVSIFLVRQMTFPGNSAHTANDSN